MSETPKDRFLKVEEHYSQRRWSEVVTPQLRLKGMWLEDYGFKPDDRAKITYLKDGKLLIERI
jgi:hypothetical protein